MKKLLLTLVMLISTTLLHGMEMPERLDLQVAQPDHMVLTPLQSSQSKPFTFAQVYYYLSQSTDPDIARNIFFLQLELSNVDLKKLLQSYIVPKSLVKYIKVLIDSCGYPLASE